MIYLSNITNLLLLYSNYSLLLAIISSIYPDMFPEYFNDIIRASTFIVPILVIYLFYSKGGDAVISAYNHLFHPIKFNKTMAIIFEFIIHLLPILLVGLPKHKISFLYVTIILLSYYYITYNKINELYHPLITTDEVDSKLPGILAICLGIAYLI